MKHVIFFMIFYITFSVTIPVQSGTFPYHTTRQDLCLLPAGFILHQTGTSMFNHMDPITLAEIEKLRRTDVNGFDRSATYHESEKWDRRSDDFRSMLYYATSVVFGPRLFRRQWSELGTTGVMWLETYYFTKGVTVWTKTLTGRKRPYLFNTSLTPEQRYRMVTEEKNDTYGSFFSGHTSAAFAMASFISTVFTETYGKSKCTPVVWGMTFSLAAITGISRYQSGNHYPSDILAGAAVGSAIGYLIPTLHKKQLSHVVSVIVLPESCHVQIRF